MGRNRLDRRAAQKPQKLEGGDVRFDPPDPSTWELDPVHQPRPWTRFMTELYAEPFARGFAAGTRAHGLLLDRRRIAFVHGLAYLSLDLVAPEQIPERI